MACRQSLPVAMALRNPFRGLGWRQIFGGGTEVRQRCAVRVPWIFLVAQTSPRSHALSSTKFRWCLRRFKPKYRSWRPALARTFLTRDVEPDLPELLLSGSSCPATPSDARCKHRLHHNHPTLIP